MVDEFVFFADSPLHIALHLSRGGESIVECYILSPYIEKFCNIIVFGKFSLGTYVIVVFNSNSRNAKSFFMAWRFLAWLCRIRRFFFAVLRCSVCPYPLFKLIFWSCVYFCYKTGFERVILCSVAVLERFTKQYFHNNLLCA